MLIFIIIQFWTRAITEGDLMPPLIWHTHVTKATYIYILWTKKHWKHTPMLDVYRCTKFHFKGTETLSSFLQKQSKTNQLSFSQTNQPTNLQTYQLSNSQTNQPTNLQTNQQSYSKTNQPTDKPTICRVITNLLSYNLSFSAQHKVWPLKLQIKSVKFTNLGNFSKINIEQHRV